MEQHLESMDKIKAQKNLLKQNKEDKNYWALKKQANGFEPHYANCKGTRVVLIILWWSKKQKLCDSNMIFRLLCNRKMMHCSQRIEIQTSCNRVIQGFQHDAKCMQMAMENQRNMVLYFSKHKLQKYDNILM